MHSLSVVNGRAHKYGDDISTDDISPDDAPANYYSLLMRGVTGEELGRYVFYWKEGDTGLIKRCKQGQNIIVAGKHFGTGSSRERSARELKAAGVRVICAEFFARIFY